MVIKPIFIVKKFVGGIVPEDDVTINLCAFPTRQDALDHLQKIVDGKIDEYPDYGFSYATYEGKGRNCHLTLTQNKTDILKGYKLKEDDYDDYEDDVVISIEEIPFFS